MEINKIYQGDTLETLRTFPNECIDMIITSPPYYALRDYGVDGQLGLEPTFQEYISKLVEIFDEAKRVLKKDGTCWVNLGDTYSGGGKGAGSDGSQKEGWTFTEKEERVCLNCGKKFMGRRFQNYCSSACSGVDNRKRTDKGLLPNKSLCNIPARFAIAMQDRGWILRNEIIWCKPNVIPSSVKDRFTVDYEKIFFFSKSKKYYFEQQKEPIKTNDINPPRCSKDLMRNMRCVWNINTQPFKGPHFAVFPEKLVETPIKAGTKKGGIVLDIFMGSGTTGVVAKKLGRNYIGIELNEEYVSMAEKRISKVFYQGKLFEN